MIHGRLAFAYSVPTTIHHGLSSSRWLLLLDWCLWMRTHRRVIVVMVMVIWHFGLWRGGWQFLGYGRWPR